MSFKTSVLCQSLLQIKGLIMKKLTAMLMAMVLGMFLTTATAFGAPIAAPDTTDIVTSIVNFGGAAIAVWLAYIIYPIAIRVLKSLFS